MTAKITLKNYITHVDTSQAAYTGEYLAGVDRYDLYYPQCEDCEDRILKQ